MGRRILILFLMAFAIVSCGTLNQFASGDDDCRFHDGIYYKPKPRPVKSRDLKARDYEEIDTTLIINLKSDRVEVRNSYRPVATYIRFDLYNGWWWDPWYNSWYSPWSYPWYRPWDPWYSPWDPWYRPWDPWYRPWYGPVYPIYPVVRRDFYPAGRQGGGYYSPGRGTSSSIYYGPRNSTVPGNGSAMVGGSSVMRRGTGGAGYNRNGSGTGSYGTNRSGSSYYRQNGTTRSTGSNNGNTSGNNSQPRSYSQPRSTSGYSGGRTGGGYTGGRSGGFSGGGGSSGGGGGFSGGGGSSGGGHGATRR